MTKNLLVAKEITPPHQAAGPHLEAVWRHTPIVASELAAIQDTTAMIFLPKASFNSIYRQLCSP
jgi:hypothetical protein